MEIFLHKIEYFEIQYPEIYFIMVILILVTESSILFSGAIVGNVFQKDIDVISNKTVMKMRMKFIVITT